MYNYNYYPEQRQAQTPNPNYTPPPTRPMGYSYQPQYPQGLKGRPVSSLEEARASSIDFDGSVFLFPDMANKKIYTKQINMDGTATLNVYELQDIPTEVPMVNVSNFITREEFEAVIGQLRNAAAPVQKLEKVEQPISEPAVRKPEVKTF